jgi:hypothetical protein
MAIIFRGVTECALCGKVLMDGDDITCPSPIADKEHPLYEYFDRGFHLQCFENWNRKEEVLSVIKEEGQKFINSDYFKKMVSKYGKPKWLDEQD